MSKRYSIYVLINPITDKLFYVGKTEQKIEKRLAAHLCDHANPKGSRSPKNRAIIEILTQNKLPVVKEVDSVYGLSNALELEKFWIKKLYKDGHPITNREVCQGGRNTVFYTTNFPYGISVRVGEEVPTSLVMYLKTGNRIEPSFVVPRESEFYLEIPDKDYDYGIHDKLNNLRDLAKKKQRERYLIN